MTLVELKDITRTLPKDSSWWRERVRIICEGKDRTVDSPSLQVRIYKRRN